MRSVRTLTAAHARRLLTGILHVLYLSTDEHGRDSLDPAKEWGADTLHYVNQVLQSACLVPDEKVLLRRPKCAKKKV